MPKPFSGSFTEAVTWEMKFRLRNAALCEQLGLVANLASVEAYVDEYNARRCMAGGWLNFVETDGIPPGSLAAVQKKTLLGRVVGIARSGKAALSAWATMFGKSGPVDKIRAESRANICGLCSRNDKSGGLLAYFSDAAAGEVMALLGALRDLDLRTSNYDDLGVCRACQCPMKAKVFVPLDNLVAKMPPETWPKLEAKEEADPKCWILTEAGR
jgi:hypothetical protein